MLKMIKFSFHNRIDIENSTKCACFHCKKVFKPKKIIFLEEPTGGIDTGVCPKCNYDTIITKEIVNALGFKFNRKLIQKVHDYAFKNNIEIFNIEEKKKLGKEI